MENMQQTTAEKPAKKKILWIIPAVVLVALLIGAGVGGWWIRCDGIYTAAMDDWEQGAYTAAAAKLNGIRGFKDAGEYLAQYEQMLTQELMSAPWVSDSFYYSNSANGYKGHMYWEYIFSEDGNCLRRDHRKDDNKNSYKVTGEYDAVYTLVYTEEGVNVRIDTQVSVHDYRINLEEDAEGIHVISLYGMMQFYDDHYSNYVRSTTEAAKES